MTLLQTSSPTHAKLEQASLAKWGRVLIFFVLGSVALLPFLSWRQHDQRWLREAEAARSARFLAELTAQAQQQQQQQRKGFLAPHAASGLLAPPLGNLIPPRGPAAAADVNTAMTFVLTTWSGDKGGWPRVSMLIASLEHFAEPGCIYELLIVTPPGDQPKLQKRAADGFGLKVPPSFRVRVITDYDALGASGREKEYKSLTPYGELKENGGRGTNYRVSMLLKLGVAAHVHTKFYLLLDSDVFLKRHVGFKDLVPEGKALLQGLGQQQRESWWQASTNLLGASHECSASMISNEFSMGVTPSILSTDIATGLLSKLGGSGKWDLAMFNALNTQDSSDWTEYTLYWVWACMSKTMSSHHMLVPGRHIYDERGFTELYSIADYPVDAIFKDTSSFFGVVQTVAGVSTEEVFAHIAPRVGM